jgi:tetratricopeptide (TPR) repeat protein
MNEHWKRGAVSGFRDLFANLLRQFTGAPVAGKATPQTQISSSSAGKMSEGGTASVGTETLPVCPLPDLHAALRRLAENTFSSDDISLLQKALALNQIVIASRGGVAIGGDASGNIIITGDNTTFTLTAEALKLLEPKKAAHILYPRNMNFTGRESLLGDLRGTLDSGSNVALTHVKTLTGLGGIGKTQLALEYSYRYQDDYDIVWWVRSEQSLTLLEDYAQMAQDLGLAGEDVKDLRLLAEMVKGFLETHNRWLLVFDNAKDAQDIKPYLPHGGRGHVIITSRNPVWGNLARALEVSKFERLESIEFLCKRMCQRDRKAADELAEALGDLPLALEQAGAYMETTAKPLGEYLKAIHERKMEVLARSRPSDYPETVGTTWDISFQAVQEVHPGAIGMLQLFSYLAPDDIPIEQLIKGAGNLPNSVATVLRDEARRDEALASLRSYSLVSRSEGKISVHRLVQAVTRDNLSLQDQRGWAEAAVKLLNDVFPADHIDNVQSWAECSNLLPHALAAAGYAEQLVVVPEATGRLLNESGLYLRTRGEFAEARSALERALEIDEQVFGKDHPEVAIGVNSLGLVLRDLGELQEAKKCFERALKIDEKVYGQDHPEVAIRVNNLGLVLRDLGELQEAKKCYERALKIDVKVYGKDHPTVATMVNNLGLALHYLGDLQEAKKCFERALKINEKVYGPDHPTVARDTSNLGSVLQDLDDLQEARKCFERALKIDEKDYGQDHPTVATMDNNLGSVLLDLGDLQEARKCFERALKIDEQVYGQDHPTVAIDVNNIGLVLRNLGDLQEARKCFERALKIDEQVYGQDHSDVARDVNSLGSVLQDLGELQKARECFRRALKIDEQVFGPDHPRVAIRVNNLGMVLKDLGELQEAKKCFERALKIFRKKLGKDHSSTKKVSDNLNSLAP